MIRSLGHTLCQTLLMYPLLLAMLHAVGDNNSVMTILTVKNAIRKNLIPYLGYHLCSQVFKRVIHFIMPNMARAL